jgi:predicted MarR family transcription regulator
MNLSEIKRGFTEAAKVIENLASQVDDAIPHITSKQIESLAEINFGLMTRSEAIQRVLQERMGQAATEEQVAS